MKFKKDIIFDRIAKDEVFFRAMARLEVLQDQIEVAKRDKYVIRNNKTVEGPEFETELLRMQIELDALQDLFKSCKEYIVEC